MSTRKTQKFVSLALALAASAGSAAAVLAQAPAPAPKAIKASELDSESINSAMKKAVEALYKMEPQYTFPPEHYYHGRYWDWETRHMMGNHALACVALIRAGELYQNPQLYRRINWVLSSDAPFTYDRGMRATMLNELPHARWAPWVRRDGVWLKGALARDGNFGFEWLGKADETGDNANGQYGVLGLWGIHEAGFEIDNATWNKIDQYWRGAQQKTEGDLAAGWGVYSFAQKPSADQLQFYSRVSGPMTAGGVATLSLTERFLRGSSMTDPKPDNVSKELRKGVRWLDENFSLDDKDEAADWFFYMWTVQRVGGATGYRTFNGVDWFRDVTARILSQQGADGAWQGDKGRMLSTGFAVLYLARANDPLAISKLRFKSRAADGKPVDANWNNRPHDIWNFTDFASDQYEVSTTWTIAELTQPPYELLESPILYLATDQAFTLSDKEIENLRAYIDGGGMLVCNAEDNKGQALKGVKELAAKLFPGQELKKIDKTHAFYDMHQRVKLGVDMQVIDNGIRPLMVFFPEDIGKGLQSNDTAGALAGKPDSQGFIALSNIYLYATGMNPRRTRLRSNFLVQKNQAPAQVLPAARVKFGGRYNPEPAATTQLKALLADKFNVDLQVKEVSPSELGDQKIAFLSTTGEGKLTPAESAALKSWVEAGGTLWIDAAGGSQEALKASREMFAGIVPNAVPQPLLPDNPVYSGTGIPGGYNNRRVKYRFYSLRTMGPVASPKLQAAMIDGRPGIIYSGEDLTCGLAGMDHWKIFGYTPEFARQLVANGCMVALKNPAPAAPVQAAR